MGARVYNPYTGTFTQPDPIQGGGANAYGYTDGDPVNETDLSGDSVVGDVCASTGNCTVHNGVPEPKNPTLSDVLQILTFATAPAALIDPAEDAGLAAEGEANSYLNITRAGSIRNVATDATPEEFSDNLSAAGFASRTSSDGRAQIFEKGSARYSLRGSDANGPSADFSSSGTKVLKIRLGR
jgi:uncharacterized protein RhaS with RHS repeats